MKSHIGIDVGGTFTDFCVSLPGGIEILHKVPSTPDEPDRAIVAGLRDLLQNPRIPAASVDRLAHGTTVGTNALIQRQVGQVALVTTAGFRDLLEIGRQTRPHIYDIHTDFPKPFVPRHLRLEVRERMQFDGTERVPLNESDVRNVGKNLRKLGIDCVAVCFLHSHAWPAHERRAAGILRKILGDDALVITSSEVHPEFREYERFSTTVLNAALLTVMHAYLDRLENAVSAMGIKCAPTVSRSAGGLMSIAMARRFPIRTALSGPAAGAIGAAARARAAGFPEIITLDVGGTSADVALLAKGELALVHSRVLAGFPLRLPAIDVNSVGAGGGSIAWIDRDGLLKVGPQSAGAVPGPACYHRGGTLATVTDAQVLLGRLDSVALLDGRMPIRRDFAEKAVADLARKLDLPLMETAMGIVRLVCAAIVKAIRSLSVERGHDPAGFTLFVFGGAGPLHATETARELGIRRIFVPPHPGILCAEGLLNSDLAADYVQSTHIVIDDKAAPAVEAVREVLRVRAKTWFDSEHVPKADQKTRWTADLRYSGQNFELSLGVGPARYNATRCRALATKFHAEHERSYGFSQPNEPIELVSLRANLTGVLDKPRLKQLSECAPAQPIAQREVYFALHDRRHTPVYRRADLAPGQVIRGPAIFEQMDSTTPLFPGDVSRCDIWGNLIIDLSPKENS